MRYLLGFLATIGLIILILVLLLRGGDSTPAAKALRLADYAKSDSAAHLTIDGPVVANQNHQEVKIDVTGSDVTFSLYDGYQGNLLNRQTYSNNQEAYTTFLLALQHQGFTIGNPDPAMKDERGYCPQGQRHIYSFTDGSKQLMRYWSTGCDIKTFKGKADSVIKLFKNQVSDYDKLTRGTHLSSSF